ncbi:DinB family protein [Paenibacillus puerhi]|uniref:DinB family protein n=1 Tax=Paenibacillus puerhi TaxID=2692622 RepID=UPI00135ADFB0|nr:DinB family protein [Paenibacillus puerhi]
MKHTIEFSLQTARDWCIDVVSDCPAELADIQVKPFPNTIRWQTGHILIVAERMLFRYPERDTGFLPVSFSEWFESGTTPADWTEQPPSLEELISLLKMQQERIRSIAPKRFDDRLDPLYFGYASLGECAGFVVVHEAFHAGKMMEMLRVIKQQHR